MTIRTIGTIAAEDAIKAHTKSMRIEGDMQIQAWHLVLSLREFCAVNAISFDELLSDTQRYIIDFGRDCDFRHMS